MVYKFQPMSFADFNNFVFVLYENAMLKFLIEKAPI